MPAPVTISSVEFRNFKAFRQFSISLQQMNILVGPNNSGKSTILGAFTILAEAIRKARARSTEWVASDGRDTLGHVVPAEGIPISLENVHTDYSDDTSAITFRFTNGNTLQLYFPRDGGCNLIPTTTGKYVRTPSDFKREFPVSIGMVPVLGPVEHEENLLDPETVRRGLNTHRASRHFRNYWYYNPGHFDAFADLVSRTWPGMLIKRVDRADRMSNKLVMFALEERISRELYWSGFGFQVWCQLLTHISRASTDTILIIDEPEVYLHPDLQRQLLGVLRDSGPSVLLATHSAEIMAEADPSEILLVDKKRRSPQRLKDLAGVQIAMEAIGSLQNVTLLQLARNRKVVFVEGAQDFKTIRRFAKRAGLAELAAGTDLTSVESGGFAAWERIKATAWGIERTLGGAIAIGAIFDRDYLCPEEVAAILQQLRENLQAAHILDVKEMENYLLAPAILQRALAKATREQVAREKTETPGESAITDILEKLTKPLRAATQSQYISNHLRHCGKAKRDSATVTAEAIAWFDERWERLETRLHIVPGKEVLRQLRDEIQRRFAVNLTDIRIIDEFRRDEVPQSMMNLLDDLNQFRMSTRDT